MGKVYQVYFEHNDNSEQRPITPGWVVIGIRDGRLYVRGPAGIEGASPIGSNGVIPMQTLIPTRIEEGESFVIPTDTQALYAMPILNDGTMILDGVLVGA